MSGTDTRERLGLEVGTPALKSIGPIAFGPDGILFAADNVGASIVALDVGDGNGGGAARAPDVEDLDARLAAFLGTSREDVHIRDLAVHPGSGEPYLSIMRGSGAQAIPLLVRIAADGSVHEVALEGIPFARTSLDDAPTDADERQDIRVVPPGDPDSEVLEIHGITLHITRDPLRTATITDLAYVDGTLLVAGASNEEFTSSLRRIPFPFEGAAHTSPLEIFHVSHGKYETHSPIRSFVPYEGGASILASYTCTPVVHFSLGDLADGEKASGRTVAELGAMNTPLDMVSFTRDGEEHLLVCNSRHPMFRIACKDIDTQEGLTAPTEPTGVPRQELSIEGVTHMAAVEGQVLMLHQDESGARHLRSYDTASL